MVEPTQRIFKHVPNIIGKCNIKRAPVVPIIHFEAREVVINCHRIEILPCEIKINDNARLMDLDLNLVSLLEPKVRVFKYICSVVHLDWFDHLQLDIELGQILFLRLR